MPSPDRDSFRLGRLSPSQRAKLQELLRTFATVRGRAKQEFTSVEFPEMANGVVAGLPWIDYAPPVAAFWDLIDELRLAAAPFDWPRWAAEIRGHSQELFDPALIASFSPADLRRYLTMLNRIERFDEGTWATALERDAFDAILTRLLQLDSEGQLAIGEADLALA